MRLPARRTDDADVIRARLRALLAEGARPGWVPEHPADAADEDDVGGDGDEVSASSSGRTEALERTVAAGAVGRHRASGPAVRVDPGRPGARALWIAAVVAVAILLLWTWVQRPSPDPVPVGSTQPAEEIAVPSPPSTAVAAPSVGEVADTSTTVVVSVVGQVARPGLVTLAPGSRVADAVEAAGGLLRKADPASVNLAAVVADGQQVAVGVPGAAGAVPADPSSGAAGAGGAVNLNTADATALDGLPGIGPVLAQRIVEHREQQGPFRAVDDLLDVPGIGPAILGDLADAVTL